MRLNKITKELNVGFDRIVEFLEKKGVTQAEWSMMSNVTDEQYKMLCKEFSKDKGVKEASEREREQRQQVRDKIKEETRQVNAQNAPKAQTPTDKSLKQQFKIVGSIELDKNGNPKRQDQPKQQGQQGGQQRQQNNNQQRQQQGGQQRQQNNNQQRQQQGGQQRQQQNNNQQRQQQNNYNQQQQEQKKVAWGERSKDRINDEPLPEEARNGEVFRYNTSAQDKQLNVLGSIDLDSLNQSTRPKKKSKEEKKREREQKAQNSRNSGDKNANSGTSGHRQHGAQKVDINEEIKHGKARDAKGQERRERKDQQSDEVRGKKNAQKKDKRQNTQQYRQQQPDYDMMDGSFRPDKKSAKYRKEKRNAAALAAAEAEEAQAAQSHVLKLTEFVTANDLATMMNIPVVKVISTCMSLGMMVSINQRLEAETIDLVASEFGFETQYVSEEVEQELEQEQDTEDQLESRPPIITVMGHVDHGKTKLLDYIRNTNVIAGEAGGITQHIGAYNVQLQDGRHVTFLDTPGHEAFTAMRARGAKMTDIAIIIVAADDGIMPQTKEAINHAAAAGVPIVFAINKIDKPTANPNRVKEQLAAMNYLVEEWGGKYQSQDISARDGLNVEELLEKCLLEAEMLDLKANPNREASGSIIEATLDKGRGYVASVLVQNGTLHIGDVVLAGKHYGRVKALFNERGQKVETAGPACPVQILGLDGAPSAGDQFRVMETEQEAREIANKRDRLQREQALRTQKVLTLDEIGRRLKLGDFQELNLIVKGDVDGSVEALTDSLIKLSTENIQINVIHKAVGQISESDIVLAAASKAIIIGFQVRPSAGARRLADQDGVDIRTYSIIYDAIEEVKEAMEGMLKPIVKEEYCGEAEVKSVFKITKVGAVAGCLVKNGKIHRTDKARIIRDGIVVYTGELAGLKRFKDDVKEVSTNFECGLSLVNYDDIREGDIIECFTEVEVMAKL